VRLLRVLKSLLETRKGSSSRVRTTALLKAVCEDANEYTELKRIEYVPSGKNKIVVGESNTFWKSYLNTLAVCIAAEALIREKTFKKTAKVGFYPGASHPVVPFFKLMLRLKLCSLRNVGVGKKKRLLRRQFKKSSI